ncbi:DUF1289 domain-containing protein [Antarctobacter jejuensis]|uniref:DUF1289 domain-containing protein n=1 Tax=Antarctobacter jejuensis TaxID=1439938 RepID=UPI003FD25AEC
MSRIDRQPPASPCVARCVIDEASQLCTGCARKLDEIAVWGSASEDFRAQVWAELPARAAALGLATRRLSLRGEALLADVAHRLTSGTCKLTAGVWGASAEFTCPSGDDRHAVIAEDRLTLTTDHGALRLDAPSYLTAFEIERPDDTPLLALAVPQGRAFRDMPRALTPLGSDPDPLLPRDAKGARFDLGLGRRAARFMVRCDKDLARDLHSCTGVQWPDHLQHLGQPLAMASPVRIVETPCLKVEIDAPIPDPDGTSPVGPHTHLLPDHVAQGLDLPPTVPLPAGYVAVALILSS